MRSPLSTRFKLIGVLVFCGAQSAASEPTGLHRRGGELRDEGLPQAASRPRAAVPPQDRSSVACVVVADVKGQWTRMSQAEVTTSVRIVLDHWLTHKNAETLISNHSIIDWPMCDPADFSITVVTRVVLLPAGRHTVRFEVRDTQGLRRGKYTGGPSSASTRIISSPVCIDNPPCPHWISWKAGLLSTLERGLLTTLDTSTIQERTNVRG